MADLYVRRIGEVIDIDDAPLVVKVDYDSVVIGRYRFYIGQVEELAQLLVRACWEAGRHAERMRQPASE